MLTSWRTSILRNLFLVAAIQNIDLPNAGCASVLPNHGQLETIVVSQLWMLKMRTYFSRYDFNKDGVIRRVDLESMAMNFADREGFSQAETKAVIKCFDGFFSVVTQTTGTNDDVPLTVDLLIETMKMYKDCVELKKIYNDLLNCFITRMKVDQDGYFSYPEYRRIFESEGLIDVDFTKVGFDLIDSDHDGRVSTADILNALMDYLCSDDVASTALYGLL